MESKRAKPGTNGEPVNLVSFPQSRKQKRQPDRIVHAHQHTRDNDRELQSTRQRQPTAHRERGESLRKFGQVKSMSKGTWLLSMDSTGCAYSAAMLMVPGVQPGGREGGWVVSLGRVVPKTRRVEDVERSLGWRVPAIWLRESCMHWPFQPAR